MESSDKKLPKEPQHEPQALDLKERASAFTRKIITGFVSVLKESKDEDLKNSASELIRCFARYYTLTEMGLYLMATTGLSEVKVVKVYLEAQSEDLEGGQAYEEFAKQRQAQREQAAEPLFQQMQLQAMQQKIQAIQQAQHQATLQQIQAIQQNQPAHVCGPDCDHDEVGTSSQIGTSEVRKRNPRRKP